MHHKAKQLVAYIIVILLSIREFAKSNCPSKCKCFDNITVHCNGKDLRVIPKGIPLTAKIIDFSNNPQLQIPKGYFLQFKYLVVLILNNCGQRGPVHLPSTVNDVRLDDNFFTMNALEEMLSINDISLKKFSVAGNYLSSSDVKTMLRILPVGLTLLRVNDNELKTLAREEMQRFKDMRELQIHHCHLESIEANAFDTMTQLHKLNLKSNELQSLADDLFKFNADLYELHLNDNKLVEFNSTKLGLKKVNTLKVAYNNLLTFDIRNLKTRIAMLSNNNIRKIDTRIFHSNPATFEINLSSNNIEFLSRDVFHGIRKASQILLNNNSLESLPRDIFKGMMINNLFLQHNNFSSLNGAFHGIQNHPVTVMLTGNNYLVSLNGNDFQSLPHKSKIYLNCGKLTKLSSLSELQAKIECIPRADKTIRMLYHYGFSCNGFQCKDITGQSHYQCKACRQGYTNVCMGKTKDQGKCEKCPAGSYYQDELASTKCKICRPGQFVPPERSPGTSASDCQTCPQGTNTTIEAGTRACNCLNGYSRLYRFGKCKRCTEHGFNCNKDYQVLRNGFWMTWQGTTPDHTIHVEHWTAKQRTCEVVYKEFIRNLDTTDDTYDRTTMHFNCQMPLPIKCPLTNSCVGGIQPRCFAGYTGVLCAVCKRDYRRQFNQCVHCPSPALAAAQSIFDIALFGIFCFIISLASKISFEYTMNYVRRGQKCDHRTLADIMLSSFKILIGFYQILVSIIHGLSNVHWPQNLIRAINILQHIQFQIIKFPSLRCINSEWKITAIDEFWITLIIIIAIPSLSVAYYFIKSAYIYFQLLSPSAAKQSRNECGRRCINFVALFLFATYTLILTHIIEILPFNCHSFCTAKQNGTCVHAMSFLRSDYSIPCPTMDKNNVTLVIGYCCLILPCGMPILLWLLLSRYAKKQSRQPQSQNNNKFEEQTVNDDEYCNQNNLHVFSMNDDPIFGDCDVPIMTSALKFTYENYHSRYWYWEVVEMIRKLLMTIGIVLFVGHTKIGLTCTIMVAMFFTIMHAIVKPFKNKFESGAQLASLTLVPLNMAFGAVLQWQDGKSPNFINKESDSLSLGSLIVAMNSCLILVMFGRIIGIIAMKLKSKIMKS